MSFINDIVRLAETCKAAQELAERADSLGQAIDESKQRLEVARAEEGKWKREAELRRAYYNELERQHLDRLSQFKAHVDADIAKRKKAAEEECILKIASAELEAAQIRKRHDDIAEETVKLRAVRDAVEAQVKDLKAELEALRARLG